MENHYYPNNTPDYLQTYPLITNIQDYIEYKRDTISISPSELLNLQTITPYNSSYQINEHSVLVFRSYKDYSEFLKNKRAFGEYVAIGYSLGYPLACAIWYKNLIDQENYAELTETGTIDFGSYSFKCPEHLIEYAKDDLLKTTSYDSSIRMTYRNSITTPYIDIDDKISQLKKDENYVNNC